MLELEDEEQIQRLQMIIKLVDQLSAMLSGAVDQGHDHDDLMIPIDLAELVHSMVNLLQYQSCNNTDIQLDLAPYLRCRLPARGLTRSLYQLLYNALEATRQRQPAEIRLTCRNLDGQLQIQILDNGPGLPRELLDKGLRTYASTHPGAALGLSSVERFAAGLGGRLELQTGDTGGACVSLWLPMEYLEQTDPV
jgi:signal transduction histidine kinase